MTLSSASPAQHKVSEGKSQNNSVWRTVLPTAGLMPFLPVVGNPGSCFVGLEAFPQLVFALMLEDSGQRGHKLMIDLDCPRFSAPASHSRQPLVGSSLLQK